MKGSLKVDVNEKCKFAWEGTIYKDLVLTVITTTRGGGLPNIDLCVNLSSGNTLDLSGTPNDLST